MQHMLRFIGIDRSYLFLNSFIYPIFGQYSMDLRPLAQDPRSPIAQHRNRIFDKAIIDGDVRLVIAVGTAAKESVVTWIRAHGGSAQSDALHNANMGSIPNRVRAVGVLHPGGASSGSTAGIKADFQKAVNRVRGWVADDASWLPADPGMTRNLSTPYPYSSVAIPFRDFPFGTCPRLGRGSTSSNRSDGQRAIRLFYRGRFRQLSLVVLADQASQDDLFSGHAMSGEAGQRLQGFLRAAGLSQRYLILRSIPVDTLDLTASARNAIADDARVRAVHRELLARIAAANGGLAALVAVGSAARRLAPNVVPTGLPIVQLAAHGGSGWAASWQAGLTDLASRTSAKDLTSPTFSLPSARGQVPRIDLPYGTPRWVGTSGDRGVRPRDLDTGRPSPDYLKVFLPSWIAALGPAPLTPAEQHAADQLT
jgi:hypothetical protein